MPRMKAYVSRAGYQTLLSDVPGEVMNLAREIYASALTLAEPIALAAEFGAEELREVPLPDALQGYTSYSAMLFSLGGQLDAAIERYFSNNEPLKGLLLDSWGSESVEALAGNTDARLRGGRGGSIRFAPGYGGFDVRYNYDWLRLISEHSEEKPPVSVNPDTGIITPRKSIICMIGWA